MSKTIKFAKKDGEIQYGGSLLNQVNAALNTIANGDYILSIKREIKKRTLDQNALMWLWFTCIEIETGTHKQIVHDYYCTHFLRKTTSINGRDKVIISGTSKLNTVQFTDFLNKVQADAASEFGIRLPLPEDLNFEHFREYYERYIN